MESNIEVSHLTIQNTPFWTVHPVYVTGFHAHHLWIFNPSSVSNTDGIDPDSTRNVLIHDCYIVTGDDGIAIKSGWDEYGYQYGRPSENITIRNCNISTPCAALAIGSEMSGGVSGVHVSNCHLWDSTAGVHIKSGPGRGGYVRNISRQSDYGKLCGRHYDDVDTGGHPPDDQPPFEHECSPRYTIYLYGTWKGKQNIVKMIGLADAPLKKFASAFTLMVVSFSVKRQRISDVVPTPCSNFLPRKP